MRGVIWFFSMTIFTYLCFCFSSKTLTETGYEKYNEVTCFHAVWLPSRGMAVLRPSGLPAPGTAELAQCGRQGSPFLTWPRPFLASDVVCQWSPDQQRLWVQ